MFVRTGYFARCCLGLACLAAGAVVCAESAEITGPADVAVGAPAWRDATALRVQSVHVLRAKDGAEGEFEYLPADAIQVQRRGETSAEALAVGTFVGAQDTLITGADRIVQVRFSDGTLMVLGRGARLRITDRYLSKSGLGTVLTLYQGIVRVQVSELAARGGFYLHTPETSVQVTAPGGLVARHRDAETLDGGGQTRVTLLFGACQIKPVARAEAEKANLWSLEAPGEQFEVAGMDDVEPTRETLDAAATARLVREVPFLFDGTVRLAEKVELPAPIPSLAPVEKISLAPSLPDAIPGPPALDDPAFQYFLSGPPSNYPYRTSMPASPTPVNGISPSGP